MTGIRKFLAVAVCCAMLCSWGITQGCSLGAAEENSASHADTGSGDTGPDAATPMPETAAMEDGSSPGAEVSEENEQDFEKLAESESRKDWLLAIEKARKAFKESADEYKDTADSDIRVTDLKEEEQGDSKFKQYQIVLRVDEKTCSVLVKQESEDKYTAVAETDDGQKVTCSAASSEEE